MRLAVLLGCGLMGLAPVSAQAQLSPGTSGFSDQARTLANDDSLRAIRDLGNCLARTKIALARAFVSTTPGTSAEVAASRALIGKNTACLSLASRARMPIWLLRGVVTEALYKNQQPTALPKVGTPLPATLSAQAGQSEPYALLADFSRCFAATHPDELHYLLTQTRIGTKEERAAFTGVQETFGSCLPARVKLGFDPMDIRFALAEAAYRRSATGFPQMRQR